MAAAALKVVPNPTENVPAPVGANEPPPPPPPADGGDEAFNPNDPTQRSLLTFLNVSEGKPSAVQGEGYVDLSGAPRDTYGFPVWGGRPGPKGQTHAAGSFQFEPHTWAGVASEHGLDFRKPEDQEAGAWYLAQKVYRQKTGRDLTTDLRKGDTASVRSALAGTWATQKGAGVRSAERKTGIAGEPPDMSGLPPEMAAGLADDYAHLHALQPGEIHAIEQTGEVYKEEIAALQTNLNDTNSFFERMTGAEERLVNSMPDQFKLQQQELLKVSDQPRDPSRIFTQLLPLIAIFGGAFTNAGAMGAMAAAAGAMNAARAHDDAALKRADEEFKNQLTETMDKSTMIHEMLTDGLAKAKGDAESILQIANLTAKQFEIPALEAAVYEKDIKAITDYQNALTKVNNETLSVWKSLVTTSLAQARLAQAQQKAVQWYDADTGNTVWQDQSRPIGHQIVDKNGNELDPQPQHLEHSPSGRVYGGMSGYINQKRQEWQMEHPGEPLPGDMVLQWSREYTVGVAGAKDFATGPEGRKIRSFNAAIMHLDSLAELAAALKNGDNQTVNWLAQTIAAWSGKPAPVNFDAAKQIVGSEIVNAIVAGGGSAGERDQAREAINKMNSPEQLIGAINTYKDFATKQLLALQTQYEATGGTDFEKYLSPASKQIYDKAVQEQHGGFDRDDWIADVHAMRQAVRDGKMTKDQMREELNNHYPTAGKQAVDQAINLNN